MNCGPVCVRILWSVVEIIAIWGILLLFYLLDEDMREYKWGTWWLLGTVLGVLGSLCLYPGEQQGFAIYLGFFFVNLYLVVSATMDIMLKMVTDVVHYLGLAGGGILILQKPPEVEVCKELIVYIIIQYFVFRRMYGRADVMGFVLCAFFLASTNRGIGAYIGHMSLVFGLLALVQVFRRNIAYHGNLKHPVALFPYILCGFFLII